MFYVLIFILLIVVFVVSFRKNAKTEKQIEKEGIETIGVISKFELSDSDSPSKVWWYVKYTDQNGEERESFLYNNKVEHYDIGQQVRIKYIMKERTFVLLV